MGQDKQPRGLLQALSARGYHLLPEQGDTEFIELPEGQKVTVPCLPSPPNAWGGKS